MQDHSPAELMNQLELTDHNLIESLVDAVLRILPPSSGGDLLGFEMDTSLYFIQSPAFADTKVERTNDPRCLIQASATLADNVSSVQDIWRALRGVWQSMMYKHFAACSIASYREATRLRFVTVIGGNHFHVTGVALVHGPKYPDLVTTHDRDFGQYGGPLQPLPGGMPSWVAA